MTLAALQLAVAQALTFGAVAEGLDADALRLASELLVAKRRAEAAGWLPRTVQALGPAFRSRFAVHARASRPGGWNHPRADAIAFAETVIQDAGLPLAVRDLSRYEHAAARATRPGPLVVIIRIPRLAGDGPPPPSGVHIWWRWHRGARLGYLRLPLP